MLVRPGGVAAGGVDDAEDGVGAHEVPRVDGGAFGGRIAVQLLWIDGGDAAIGEAGAGSSAVQLGLIDVDAFVVLGGVAGDDAGRAVAGGVYIPRGDAGRREGAVIGDVVVDAHGAGSSAGDQVHQAGEGVGWF